MKWKTVMNGDKNTNIDPQRKGNNSARIKQRRGDADIKVRVVREA